MDMLILTFRNSDGLESCLSSGLFWQLNFLNLLFLYLLQSALLSFFLVANFINV